MAHEVGIGLSWLKAVLVGDATLMSLAPGRVYRGKAPANVATPFIIIAMQSGTDATTMNAVRVMTNGLFQVRAGGPASNTAAIEAAASRIDELLGHTAGTITGGLILSCHRESPLQYDEDQPNGDLWSNFGGLYRLQIQKQ